MNERIHQSVNQSLKNNEEYRKCVSVLKDLLFILREVKPITRVTKVYGTALLTSTLCLKNGGTAKN